MTNKNNNEELLNESIEKTLSLIELQEVALKFMRDPSLSDEERLQQVLNTIPAENLKELLNNEGNVLSQLQKLKNND